ncbi:MAG: hypothetical protein J6P40_02155 [Oscillospiraceae bacterium]|nr:hypothetical protein [Oscillospiraceae bacterium]
MMHDEYLTEVIRRGNELTLLEQAASLTPSGHSSAVRWIVATACGLLFTLIPSVCGAQAFFQMM